MIKSIERALMAADGDVPQGKEIDMELERAMERLYGLSIRAWLCDALGDARERNKPAL